MGDIRDSFQRVSVILVVSDYISKESSLVFKLHLEVVVSCLKLLEFFHPISVFKSVFLTGKSK